MMQKCGLAICTPMPITKGPFGDRFEPITVEWQRARHSLALPTNCNWIGVVADGMEVGEARSHAVDVCMAHDPIPEFLFFLDYDVIPLYDAVMKLVYRARCYPDHDIFSGVYTCKSAVPEPLIYNGDGGGGYWDWAVGDLLLDKITSIHMGLTLIRTSLFGRMDYGDDNPLFSTIQETVSRDPKGGRGLKLTRSTEDLFFCKRAVQEVGAKILVDTSVLAGHIDNKTGRIYGLPKDSLPFKRALWAQDLGKDPDKEDEPEEELKKALDLGAGGGRREWDGYETETTDLRADTEPNYVMDTRWLNLPDESYDLVASSHHLEHIGRFEQEKVWDEMFRITKPGGKFEHIVPNLEWAAWKVADGTIDEHVFNVLYGAQESQGYERQMNTHFFAYTPLIAKQLAEQAGYTDVETKDYKEDPELGYNLIVTGRKVKATVQPEDKLLPSNTASYHNDPIPEETTESLSQGDV